MVSKNQASFRRPHEAHSHSISMVVSQQHTTQYQLFRGPKLSASTYDELLLWKFLTYFSENAGSRVWTATLPNLVAAKNKVALRTAARALSLAFAAQNMHDEAMMRQAQEIYGTSLRYHQFSFKALPGKDVCRAKARNALPVTVLLSYYEMIQATTASAWLRHTLAAERLFVLLGTEIVSNDPLLNHLYFIIRVNSAVRCFLLGSTTAFTDTQWTYMEMLSPCGETTKVFHKTINIIMQLLQVLHGQPGEMIATITQDLDHLWSMLPQVIGSQDRSIFEIKDSQDNDSISEDLFVQDPSAALTGSFLHAAAILVIFLQNIVLIDEFRLYNVASSQKSNDGVECARSLRYHAKYILRLSRILRRRSIGCACLRMILPLAIVHRLSGDPECEMLAQSCFTEWCVNDGLPGLPLLAFDVRPPFT